MSEFQSAIEIHQLASIATYPSHYVVGIEIHKILAGLALIICFHVVVISFSMTVSDIANTTAHAFFNELKHINICHQLKFNSRLFQRGIP